MMLCCTAQTFLCSETVLSSCFPNSLQFTSIQEFTGEDDSDLYLEERENALRAAEQEKRKVQMAVPGILNPHEIPEEMQD